MRTMENFSSFFDVKTRPSLAALMDEISGFSAIPMRRAKTPALIRWTGRASLMK